jgi:hypothetical protein
MKNEIGSMILMAVLTLGVSSAVGQDTRETLISSIDYAKTNITVRSHPDSLYFVATRLNDAIDSYFKDDSFFTDYIRKYGPLDSLRRVGRQTLEWIRAVSDTMLYNTVLHKWGKKVADAVSHKEIFLGMPRDALTLSWGEPADINETVTTTLKQEQFVYGELGNGTLVYVVHGKVNSWQDF